MDHKFKKTKAALFFILILQGASYAQDEEEIFSKKEINTLAKDVKAKNWSYQDKLKVFSSKDLKKIPKMIKVNVTKPIILKHDKYAHFLKPKALERAYLFSRHWRGQLRKAAKKFKVDPEAIVGILHVETQFGKITGKYLVLSVYASTYVDAKELLKKGGLGAKMKKRVIRKKNWAQAELSHLLTMNKKYNQDLFTLKGSYAGAFGHSQFLPSSYMNYAVRAIGKGKPDLFYVPDAIFSVANYLSRHGYLQTSQIETKRNRKAVYRYNHSDVYVDTVIDAAKGVRKIAHARGHKSLTGFSVE